MNTIASSYTSSLIAEGWKKCSIGSTKRQEFDKKFDLYKRIQNINGITNINNFNKEQNGDKINLSPIGNYENPGKTGTFSHGFKDTMGSPLLEAEPKTPIDTPMRSESTVIALSGSIKSGPKVNCSKISHNSNSEYCNDIVNDTEPVTGHIPFLYNFMNLNSCCDIHNSLIVSYATVSYGNPRIMLSWQFAVIQYGVINEYVFVKKDDTDLWLELALGRILDDLKYKSTDVRTVRYYEACSALDAAGNPVVSVYHTKPEAAAAARYAFVNDKATNIRISAIEKKDRHFRTIRAVWDNRRIEPVPVTLLCHSGKNDISGLDQGHDERADLITRCVEVQDGIVTIEKPIMIYPQSVDPTSCNHPRIFAVCLSVRDTMCHTPKGHQKFCDMAKPIGIPAISLQKHFLDHMDQLLREDPVLFLNYAGNNALIILLYASALYDYNEVIPVTLTSVSARVFKACIYKELLCHNNAEFDRRYRGLSKTNHGKYMVPERACFLNQTSLEPVNDKSARVQMYASSAYHGGYNSSSIIGCFDELTFDYDLKSAYPTAMCLVPDIDWEDPIITEIRDQDLTISNFFDSSGHKITLPMMIGYVTFEFPEEVKYPCIPINVDGTPVYPRTSEGYHGIYACGPELFLAVSLGAHVHCESLYILRPLIIQDKVSFSMRRAVYQLVQDRNHAKEVYGCSSLEEQILKYLVNSGYGKIAQNVVKKEKWSVTADAMEERSCSEITNPVNACMITSIVRSVLIAAENQLTDKGYKCYSVTTDGLISNAPENVLYPLDLYGIGQCMEEARKFLADGCPDLWEIKHVQDDLLNFTTRGNVSLHDSENHPLFLNGKAYAGVCAHNGAKSGYDSDSAEDRMWLMIGVLGRTGRVSCRENVQTKFKDLCHGLPYAETIAERHISMDFDMKRKPVEESAVTVFPIIDGKKYEIMNFDTVPFDTVEEFSYYRTRKELCTCLRTAADWKRFRDGLNSPIAGTHTGKPADEWTILFSCIMGYRAGRWVIPALEDKKRSVQQRCDWINTHNNSKHLFKISDWKNARNPDRIKTMLPREDLEKKLMELISDKKSYKKSECL